MAKKTKRERLRETIRQDLQTQLKNNGTAGQYYLDLIDDYMDMWDTKNGLTADIRERGEKVPVYSAHSSAPSKKTNDSVIDLLKVNAQMLKLLDSMGIKPAQVDGENNGEM